MDKKNIKVAVLLMAVIAMTSMASAMTPEEAIALKERFSSQQHTLADNVRLDNSFVSIVVAPDGTYTMGTADGKRLLYGYPNPGTSYLTVKIDGTNYNLRQQPPSRTSQMLVTR